MKSDFQDISALVLKLLDRIAAKAEIRNETIPTPLGFPLLDATRADSQPGDVVLIIAKSTEEKVCMMINTILQIGKNPNSPTLCFSDWTNLDDMTTSFVSAVGRIDLACLRTGGMTDSDWPRLTEAVERLRQLPLLIFNGKTITLPKLKSTVSAYYRNSGHVGQIIVDASCLNERQETDLKNTSSLTNSELQSFIEFAKKLQCAIKIVCASTIALEFKNHHQLLGESMVNVFEPITSIYLFRSKDKK